MELLIIFSWISLPKGMFWQDKRKIRYLRECLSILDILRKWLLIQYIDRPFSRHHCHRNHHHRGDHRYLHHGHHHLSNYGHHHHHHHHYPCHLCHHCHPLITELLRLHYGPTLSRLLIKYVSQFFLSSSSAGKWLLLKTSKFKFLTKWTWLVAGIK